MAQILANGLVQFNDGRILYADTSITGQDFMELQELLPKINPIIGRSAMVGFPFVSGGGGGGGAPGARGADGAPGQTGPQGVTGPSGGPSGATGVQGQTGVQGATGAGIQGATGVGTQGQTGVQGATGPGGSGSGSLWDNIQTATLTTPDATPTTILTEAVPSGTTAVYRGVVDARSQNGVNHGGVVITVRASNEGGVVTLGTVNTDYYDVQPPSTLNAAFVASGATVILQITGMAATNVDWKARMGRLFLP